MRRRVQQEQQPRDKRGNADEGFRRGQGLEAADAGMQKESNMRRGGHDSAPFARFKRAQPSAFHIACVDIDRTFRAVTSHCSHARR
jgi:hypothetical protein